MPEATKAHVQRLACLLGTEQVDLLTLHVQACSANKLLRKRLRALQPTACGSARHNDLVNMSLTFIEHETSRTVSPFRSRCQSGGAQPGRTRAPHGRHRVHALQLAADALKLVHRRCTRLYAHLVLAASCDVAHPRQRLVAALLDHLQVAHLWHAPHLLLIMPIHCVYRVTEQHWLWSKCKSTLPHNSEWL